MRSWEELKGLLRNRFRSTQEGTVEERFMALRQWGTVRDYRNCFETLASPIEEMPEAVLEGHFVNGLKPEIRAEIRVLRPLGLENIMEMAQRIEDRNQVLQGNRFGYDPSKVTPQPASTPMVQRNLGFQASHSPKTVTAISSNSSRSLTSGKLTTPPFK